MSKPDEQQIINDLTERFERLKAEREAMRQAGFNRDRDMDLFIRPHRQLVGLTSSSQTRS